MAALFRVWNQQRNSYTIFSQDHSAKCWLGLSDDRVHDAVTDASISMSLFNAYRHCQWDDNALRQMQVVQISHMSPLRCICRFRTAHRILPWVYLPRRPLVLTAIFLHPFPPRVRLSSSCAVCIQMHTLSTPRTPSYSATHPDIDGCCLGHRKTCVCGAPFFVSS